MTRPLGMASAKAPTEGGEHDVGRREEELQQRGHHAGPDNSASRAMAAMSSALSASEEKNCAAMMV